MKSKKVKECIWKYSDNEDDYYETGCGEAWQFMGGNVFENGVRFCPYCGKKIKEGKP